ncbi:GNAT family N-acetyltransferase [Pseudomonas sp. PIC25]|uniref:GNAT family N-acetyltransferase n=1 Tax=Pseudomonas sp. PIC25 TaxID=1958773 RepID=UPI000BABF5F1|nr:GNAT family N-acetyltransferase [Pseudomonas sp. PIC25]PAU66662.1 GNAT family N-acetyltransferase [Pseudomonas sp. PIC25]
MSNTARVLDFPQPEPQAPSAYWVESLADGTHVLIRPLRPEDREREREFIQRMSPEARRFRFLGTVKDVSPQLLDQLMDVDYQDRMAFVALAHEDGKLVEVGISRYAATEADKQCECAVAVADDWHGRGLSAALMNHLIDEARQNGFEKMISVDLMDDRRIRDLSAQLGFRAERDPNDSSLVIHNLQL